MLSGWQTPRFALRRSYFSDTTQRNSQTQPTLFHRYLTLLVLVLLIAVLKWNRRPISLHHQYRRISNVVLESQLKHYLSACVIARQSSDIMVEFLIRNFAAGVDHFFIYGDDDDPQEVAKLDAIFAAVYGLVTYIKDGRKAPADEEFSESYVQMRMYRHCLQTFGNTSKWVALIDVDEFFETYSLSFSNSHRAMLQRQAFLHDILSTQEMFPIICVRWKTALTNGRLRPLRKGQTLHDLFPRTCNGRFNNRSKLILRKAVLQPRFLDMEKSPQLDVAVHKGFFFTGRMEKLHCKWGLGHDLEPPLYIVHYWSRDLFNYLRKVHRGRPRKNIPGRSLTDLFIRESLCELEKKQGSQDIRATFLKRFLEKMPFYPAAVNELANVSEAMGRYHSNSSFVFCKRRVSRLIMELRRGKYFSDKNYCSKSTSTTCISSKNETKNSWPFPWAEYITSCSEEVEEDSFFM